MRLLTKLVGKLESAHLLKYKKTIDKKAHKVSLALHYVSLCFRNVRVIPQITVS